MLTWPEFLKARPDLAETARALLYQFGVGLAFLATVRRDGGPRLDPMCPIIIIDEGLFAFIVPSPKRDDLIRDGRYAMHGFPPARNEDAIYITGNAVPPRRPLAARTRCQGLLRRTQQAGRTAARFPGRAALRIPHRLLPGH